ncbi:peptide chain release factor 2 [Paraburkholderia fynbosensis]|uniref:peptide chain release factor 2 n=1 Tax=Paraburkholderia fynbosensis TaxID=1200993 RepID=UPI001581CB39|nr:peptide chain release factor 2 [Paraburkholderia fynbosensis]
MAKPKQQPEPPTRTAPSHPACAGRKNGENLRKINPEPAPDHSRASGAARRSAIISPFYEAIKIDMEAERLNAIEASLADLRTRAADLRGYL